jgi:YD repeat-containing protein
VRSKDAAANLALSSDFTFITVTVDVTLPVVSITAPAANATVSGTTTFSATATDNVGVAGVEFKLDGVLLAPEDTASPYTMAWDTTTATNGSHTLTAVAWDAAGNSATATRTVTVANVLALVKLAWNANTETDLAGYKVHVGLISGAYSLLNVDVGNVTAFTVPGLAPGAVYFFAVTAYDTSGFESGVSNEVSAAK